MARQSSLFTPVLIGGSLILLLSMAIRSSFGLFQIPIAEEFGWLRAEFSLAIAIQNLAWGIGQPIFGAIAERLRRPARDRAGGMLYAAGLVLSAFAITPGQHQVLEILVGFGIAGTGFGVILAIVGRAASDEQRSLALGIATAAGSAGQVVGPVLAEGLLSSCPGKASSSSSPASSCCQPPPPAADAQPGPASRAALQESLSQTLGKAFRDPSYTLIFVGFFSCGYQLGFITAHFPASSPRSAARSIPVRCFTGSASPRPRRWALSPSR
jgi:MFS family permease